MSNSVPNNNDIDSKYLYVLDEVERLRVHVMRLYSYYQHWGIYNSSMLYLRQHSWAFMRTNIKYVTETWAKLNTLIDSDDPPELRVLLNNLEDLRFIWHSTKTFLECVLQRSELLYRLKLVA
uniref:Dynein heavy chain tail domain-containing protein n=1 Tax=Anopheles funestus TaxID=62324 RepID=A0A4Y0BG70_ANOFN